MRDWYQKPIFVRDECFQLIFYTGIKTTFNCIHGGKNQLYANINKKNLSKACIKDVSNLYCQILFFRLADATKYFLPKPQVYLFCERAYQITFNLLLVIAYVVIKNGSISLFRFIFIENKTLIHASLSP